MPALLIIAVIVIVAVVAYYSWLQAKKRREAMAALAQQLGWQFWPDKDRSHDEEYANFEIFRRGHSRAAYNTMLGKVEIDGRHGRVRHGRYPFDVDRPTDPRWPAIPACYRVRTAGFRDHNRGLRW